MTERLYIAPNPEDPDRQETRVRVVGHRRPRAPGIRWPTPAEEAFLNNRMFPVLLRKPALVVRYRNHEEADNHMQKLIQEEAARARQAIKVK